MDSYTQGLEKVLTEKYIYIEFDQPVYDIIKNRCDIYVIPHIVTSEMICFAWGKNVPQGRFFEYFINQIKEKGVIERLERTYLTHPRFDCGMDGSLGFTNTISAFTMLTVALVASLAVLGIEHLVKFCYKYYYYYFILMYKK